jgi:uroporphyrinogen-III synthase
MRILVTRPREDAARFAERLRERGHDVLCASLLSVRFFDGPVLTLDGVQAVLATSANGVRALARRVQRRDLPLFAVGPQTAAAAQLAGFARVECADGDANALAASVPRWANPANGMLLHAASVESEHRLQALLAPDGFQVRAEVLYDVVASDALPSVARAALAEDALDATFHFSPRSAAAFRDCVSRAHLTKACTHLWAVCISQATADALNPLEFRKVLVAAKPNQDALLECLAILSQGY